MTFRLFRQSTSTGIQQLAEGATLEEVTLKFADILKTDPCEGFDCYVLDPEDNMLVETPASILGNELGFCPL